MLLSLYVKPCKYTKVKRKTLYTMNSYLSIYRTTDILYKLSRSFYRCFDRSDYRRGSYYRSSRNIPMEF